MSVANYLSSFADPLPPCTCTVTQSLEIPCFHTIRDRQNSPGLILITDIDPHWYYNRTLPLPISNQQSKQYLLEPHKIKGKGRPKGAQNVGKQFHRRDEGESSTRRNPSLFEHEAIDLPSTASPHLKTISNPPSKRPRLMTRAEAAYQAVQSSIIMPSTPIPQSEIAVTN